MARITFVYPDFECLGVEYLMAVCMAAGHEVQFVYYEAEDTYLGKADSQPDYKRIADDICRTRPDIAAFSCVTDNYQLQLHCAKAVKQQQASIVTIFGGVHPTTVPQKALLEQAIDAVAIGEAEHSLVDFLAAAGAGGASRCRPRRFPASCSRATARSSAHQSKGNWPIWTACLFRTSSRSWRC